MASQTNRPRVFVHGNVMLGGIPVTQIVEGAGCELVRAVGKRELSDALDRVAPPLALIILSLDPEPSRELESIARLRSQRGWLAETPILGVASPARLDIQRLRALGFLGLVDSGAPPEHVRSRIGQLAHKGSEGRRFERAPCCIPVELEVEGECTTAYATSLSAGGMGLACSRRIEPNTLVGLRFTLEEGKQPISVSGRIVRRTESRRADANYEVGLFFHGLPEAVRAEIGDTVSRLLAAWDTVISAGLVDAAGRVGAGDSSAGRGHLTPWSPGASQVAPPSARQSAPRGAGWARRLSALAVLAVATIALTPLAVHYTKEQRRATALSDSRMLGRAILAFYLDTGAWPVNDDAEPRTGELSRLVGLPAGEASRNRIPDGQGAAGGWAGGGDGGDAGAIEDHLIRNEGGGVRPLYPVSTTAPDPPGWNGPYLNSVPIDPWGHPYVCNTRYLIGAGIADVDGTDADAHAVLCLSAGANGSFETPFSDDMALSGPGGDDIGWAIQARAKR